MYDSEMGVRHPLRILLAEDDAIGVIVARAILERLGYQADTVQTGAELLAALQSSDYDVILMHVEMARMDGLQAAREIRRLMAERRPHIIGMAAEEGNFQRYLEGGMDDCIGKPVQTEALSTALAKTPLKRMPGEPSSSPSRQPAPAEPQGLDTTALKRLQETLGSQAEGMFPVLVEDFFRDGARLLADARSALEKNDIEQLRRSAHTLKSNGATFGALRLSSAAKELEALAKQGIFDGAAALIERTGQEFEEAKGFLEPYRKGI